MRWYKSEFCLKLFYPVRFRSGRDVIKILLILKLFTSVVVICTKLYVDLTSASMDPPTPNGGLHPKTIFRYSLLTVFILEIILSNVFLAFALSKNPRAMLKIYIICQLVFALPLTGLSIYVKVEDDKGRHSVPFCLNLSFVVFFTLMHLYFLNLIYFCYRQLQLPNLFLKLCKLSSSLDKRQKLKPEAPNAFYRQFLSSFDVCVDTAKLLGEGQYGIVYEGTFHNLPIAAKVLKGVREENDESLKNLLAELKIWARAGTHPHIVTFFGIASVSLSSDVASPLAMVTELCGRGSLESFLVQNRHTFVFIPSEGEELIEKGEYLPLLYENLAVHWTHTSHDLLRISLEVAEGMEHLSQRNIVHGDLSARNVLLSGDLRAKLSDFGLSRRLYNYQIYYKLLEGQGQAILPWRWMSPEAIEDLKFSIKSDVYSYGVLLWEIFSLGEFPHKEREWSINICSELKSGSLKLQRPNFSSQKIYQIMESCWVNEPQQRPNFLKLLEALKDTNHYKLLNKFSGFKRIQ